MSEKVVSIKTLGGDFKDKAALQEYTNKLFLSFKKSEERVKQLEAEVKHLQDLLTSTTVLVSDSPTDNFVEKIIVTDEQAIIESQIQMMKKFALTQALTLEETKQLEILVKTLKLIKEKTDGTFDGKPKRPKHISDAQLLGLASIPKKTE